MIRYISFVRDFFQKV